MPSPRYGALEGRAVRFTDARAYWFDGTSWRDLDSAEFAVSGRELTEGGYARRFPGAPQLPERLMTLFHEDGIVT